MGNRCSGLLWKEPAWRDPNEWIGVNRLIRSLKSDVEALRRDSHADVVAFYLACDPFVSNYLSCLAATGATYPDACSHFLQPSDGAKETEFFLDAMVDPVRSGLSDDERVSNVIKHRADTLFGDFVVRERIKSRGRFIYRDGESGRIIALLTVNYRRNFSTAEWNQVVQSLRSNFDRIVEENASDIRRKLHKKSQYLLPPFLGMLDVLDPLSQHGAVRGTRDLMERLLQEAIPPLDAPARRWCGTVHRVTPDGRSLELVASTGDFPTPSCTVHDLAKSEGVISWVALRKQAVRIKEMNTSEFRDVSIKYLEAVRSQLAVPILIRDGLWGTLSLEATDPNVFRRQEVGYLTRVASLAAMAAMQWEYEHIREEKELYLDAVYAAKRADVSHDILPSFEDLKSTATNPVNFNL